MSGYNWSPLHLETHQKRSLKQKKIQSSGPDFHRLVRAAATSIATAPLLRSSTLLQLLYKAAPPLVLLDIKSFPLAVDLIIQFQLGA